MTKRRALIKKIIYSSCCHLTAEEIYIFAKQKIPSIALGTVYRNLGRMEQSGEIKRISTGITADRYDKNSSEHYHLACVKCGKLEDLMPDEFKVECNIDGVEILEVEGIVRCICKDCLQNNR